MKRHSMNSALCAVLLVGAMGLAAPADSVWKFSVGFGAGFEAGNGLHLGLGKGKRRGQIGLGLIYNDQNAEFDYSSGLRYIHTLTQGRINDTYAWGGAGIQGHTRTGDRGYLAAAGMGVGASFHFGLPFHLNIDSGWDAYFDSKNEEPEISYGPTLNADLTYEW